MVGFFHVFYILSLELAPPPPPTFLSSLFLFLFVWQAEPLAILASGEWNKLQRHKKRALSFILGTRPYHDNCWLTSLTKKPKMLVFFLSIYREKASLSPALSHTGLNLTPTWVGQGWPINQRQKIHLIFSLWRTARVYHLWGADLIRVTLPVTLIKQPWQEFITWEGQIWPG